MTLSYKSQTSDLFVCFCLSLFLKRRSKRMSIDNSTKGKVLRTKEEWWFCFGRSVGWLSWMGAFDQPNELRFNKKRKKKRKKKKENYFTTKRLAQHQHSLTLAKNVHAKGWWRCEWRKKKRRRIADHEAEDEKKDEVKVEEMIECRRFEFWRSGRKVDRKRLNKKVEKIRVEKVCWQMKTISDAPDLFSFSEKQLRSLRLIRKSNNKSQKSGWTAKKQLWELCKKARKERKKKSFQFSIAWNSRTSCLSKRNQCDDWKKHEIRSWP